MPRRLPGRDSKHGKQECSLVRDPGHNKWFTRIVAALAIVTELNELNLAFPDVEKSKRKELEKVRESLEHEKD
jgi:hypothetical protein